MKKLRKRIKFLRDIITIIGIPIIGIMGWKLHQEQLNLKNFTIEAKSAEIDYLRSQRSPVIIDELQKTRAFMNSEIKRLNDSIFILNKIGLNGSDNVSKQIQNLLIEKRKLNEFAKFHENVCMAIERVVESPLENYSSTLYLLEKKYFNNGKKGVIQIDKDFIFEDESQIKNAEMDIEKN